MTITVYPTVDIYHSRVRAALSVCCVLHHTGSSSGLNV